MIFRLPIIEGIIQAVSVRHGGTCCDKSNEQNSNHKDRIPFRSAKDLFHAAPSYRWRTTRLTGFLPVSAQAGAGTFQTTLNLCAPSVMVLLPSAGFDVCELKKARQQRMASEVGCFGQGRKVLCNSQSATAGTVGRQSESRGKTLRAGTSRCEGRVVRLSHAKAVRPQPIQWGVRTLLRKCLASQHAESFTAQSTRQLRQVKRSLTRTDTNAGWLGKLNWCACTRSGRVLRVRRS